MSIFGVFSAKRFLDITLPWQHLRSQVIKNYLKGCVIYKNLNSQSFSFLDLTVSELYSKNQLGGGKFAPPVQNRVKCGIPLYFSTRMHTRERAGDALLRTMLVKTIRTVATLIDVNFHVITKAWFPLVIRIVIIRDSYDFPILGFLRLLRFLGQILPITS